MISGQKLREFREKNGVRPVDLATAMGVKRQRVAQTEAAIEVGKEVAERYVAGVLRVARGDYEIIAVEINPVLYVNGRIRPW